MTHTYILYILLAFLVSFVFTVLAMPRLLRFCKARGLYDMPNDRKVHKNKIPRLGGILFVPATVCGLLVVLFLSNHNPEPEVPIIKVSTLIIGGGVFLIYLIGVLDDLFGIRAGAKFLVQIVSALFMPFCGVLVNNLYGFCGVHAIPFWVGYPLTVFLILLIINAVNLIDGIDGLASGLSFIALACFFYFFAQMQVWSYLIFIAALGASVLAFMGFNLFGSPTRMTKTFMGDTGSLILGYTLAFLAIKYATYNTTVMPYRPAALLVSYTLLIVPVFDLTRVAFGRLSRHVGIFTPDKTHLHHLLLACGLSMHTALGCILGLQLAFSASNWLLYNQLGLGLTVLLPVNLATYLLLWYAVQRRAARCENAGA